jgi:hypothetical protein
VFTEITRLLGPGSAPCLRSVARQLQCPCLNDLCSLLSLVSLSVWVFHPTGLSGSLSFSNTPGLSGFSILNLAPSPDKLPQLPLPHRAAWSCAVGRALSRAPRAPGVRGGTRQGQGAGARLPSACGTARSPGWSARPALI